MIVDGIVIQSKAHLEEVIASLPEDSQFALRKIYDDLMGAQN